MAKASKRRAPRAEYVSLGQLVLEGFESPFIRQLDAGNRWVVLAGGIPWDEISNLYLKHVGVTVPVFRGQGKNAPERQFFRWKMAC